MCVCARANVLCTFSADRTAPIRRRARLDVRSRHCQSRVPFKQTTGATKLRRPLPSYVEGESRRGERERERERELPHYLGYLGSLSRSRACVCVCGLVVWLTLSTFLLDTVDYSQSQGRANCQSTVLVCGITNIIPSTPERLLSDSGGCQRP